MANAIKMASDVWGGTAYELTQEHGVLGFRPDWYKYSETLGFPPGYHVGLDVAVPRATPIKAAVSGTVIQEGFSDSFRPYPVWIRSDDNPATPTNEDGQIAIYGHLMAEYVGNGQRVTAGQTIGLSGEQTYKGTDTPDGSGPHIHFELRQPIGDNKFKAIDPREYLGISGSSTGGGSSKTPNIVGGISGLLFGDIQKELGVFLRRMFFVLIGLGLLGIGVTGLLNTHTKMKPSIKNVIPAGRIARAVT